jgi:hypothetical protein
MTDEKLCFYTEDLLLSADGQNSIHRSADQQKNQTTKLFRIFLKLTGVRDWTNRFLKKHWKSITGPK